LTIQSSIRLNPAWLLNGMARAQLVSMTPDELKACTKKFAVDIIQFARIIPRDPINDEIASQVTDAATSTAAHYRAVCRAKSRAEFINKLSGAIEEVDESALWLEILTESGTCANSKTNRLWREADELTRIFVRSRETARAKQRAAKQQAAKQQAAKRKESRFTNQQSTTNQQSKISQSEIE
jgi:four helix bundle protein